MDGYMNDDYRKKFDEIVSTVPIWGIDRDYVNLNSIAGPALPDWIRGKTLYEIYVRAFSEEGTIRKVTERLSRIKSLGIDVIWLMPIYPVGEEERKGTRGSPYAVQDFYRVDPEQGSAVDFLHLVQKVHELDMRIIIDMVPNHVAHDYQYLQKQADLIMRDKNSLPSRKVAEWTDIVDLDYSNPETAKHMAEIMQYWIRQFDIDGYRCDVAGLVPASFWEMVIPHLKAIKQDVFMLAEWEAPAMHKEVFHSTYDWTLYSLMLQLNKEATTASVLGDWVHLKSKMYPKNACPLRFLENHDKPRAISIFKEKSIIPYLVFLFTIDGLPLVYNGQEIGAAESPSLFESEPINWRDNNLGMYRLIKILIRLRKQYLALSTKNYTFVEHDHKEDVLVFIKLAKEKMMVVINFKDEEMDLTLSAVSYSRLKKGSVLFNSKNHFELSINKLRLLPYQAMIVRIQ